MIGILLFKISHVHLAVDERLNAAKHGPCSNCSRNKQLCQYDSDETGPVATEQSIESNSHSSSAEGELRERLARLEKSMELIIAKDQGGRDIGDVSATTLGISTVARDTCWRNRDSLSAPLPLPQPSAFSNSRSISATSNAPVGQIVFKELHSAYFDSDFWVGIVSEVEFKSHFLLDIKYH